MVIDQTTLLLVVILMGIAALVLIAALSMTSVK